jgi:hypothetical protein
VIRPRVPTETFAISWPTLSVAYQPTSVLITFPDPRLPAAASDLIVYLPSALRTIGVDQRFAVTINNQAVIAMSFDNGLALQLTKQQLMAIPIGGTPTTISIKPR